MGPHPIAPIHIAGGLSETYPAAPESVPRAREVLAAFAAGAGARCEELDRIRTAASEALTNAVVHAYAPRVKGHVHIAARLTGRELWILVADDGCGLRARSDSPGLGFGLTLIAQVCDDFSVQERSSGGTELQMRFALGEPGGLGQSRGSVSSATAPA